MFNYKKAFTKKISIIASIISGVLLFTAIAFYFINSTLLNADYHKKLFEKHNIYDNTQKIVSSSLKDFINNFKKSSPENYENYKDTFIVLENTINPQMIKNNLYSITTELFQYFSGEKIFLPDIYLNSASEQNNQDGSVSAQNPASHALSKINKINLSIILSYIDRNDISDTILLFKFYYTIMSQIPIFSFILFLTVVVLYFLICNTFTKVFRYIKTVLIVFSILGIIVSVSISIYSYTGLQYALWAINMSIPLDSEVILSYARSCTLNVSLFILITSILGLILVFLLSKFKAIISLYKINIIKKINVKHKKILKYSTIIVLLFSLSSILFYNAQIFKKVFYSSDFTSAIAKIRNTNTVTQVISAKDDAIYALQIKMVDETTGNPVHNVKFNITGKSTNKKKDFNESSITDENGLSKFTLDEGTFRLNFNSSSFPIQYQMPSPFFFDLKKAGTTLITISLNKIQQISKSKWGISEIEVLDYDNKPLKNIELEMEGVVSAPGYPDKIHSYTNLEGIAVFKINEGSHKIKFTPSKFPEKFSMPSSFDITVTHNAITRYTIKLSKASNQNNKN